MIRIKNLADTIFSCFRRKDSTTQTRRVCWHSSMEAGTILNVDGSSLGNPGRVGFGGVIQSSEGEWIAGFASFIGHSNNLHVELLAILNGLLIGWNKDFRNIICYSNSLNVVNLVKESMSPFHKYATIILDIHELLGRNWSVKFSHTLREGNGSANYMAKHGASIEDHLKIFEVPPVGMSSILLADMLRVEFTRN